MAKLRMGVVYLYILARLGPQAGQDMSMFACLPILVRSKESTSAILLL